MERVAYEKGRIMEKFIIYGGIIVLVGKIVYDEIVIQYLKDKVLQGARLLEKLLEILEEYENENKV